MNQTESVNQVCKKINEILKDKEYVIVAIDGRCGSGKTVLAQSIEKQISCNVIHMDDFFLREEQRSEERLKRAGENVDHERFLEEVLKPLSLNKSFEYCPYSCKTKSLGESVKVKPKRVTIVEGSYSCHKNLWNYYDLHIFMDIDKETQTERILKRNGAKMAKVFEEKWIPLEESYFEEYSIEEKCEMSLCNNVLK